VYRGFLDETNKLTFVTDRRSKKINELNHSPWVELCWYFPQTREQYRIAGKMDVIKVDEGNQDMLQAREKAWKRMSDGGRSQFAWPYPGLERGDDDSLFSPGPFTEEEPPLSDFCLLVLDPIEVDHLSLKSNERYLYKPVDQSDGDTSWSQLRVNP
jgi:PPOX class probable FMN-dependent enzyme